MVLKKKEKKSCDVRHRRMGAAHGLKQSLDGSLQIRAVLRNWPKL